ncbi:MAG TPA: chemotaxis protein CheW [Gemmatimonadales bacterium]|nr:chemotaxis protein CheW [Gemmatimonadales bacterium]
MAMDDEIQLVAFRAGPQEFALDILQVERILRYQRPTPLPRAPDFLQGMLSHEGGAVPVVDFRTRLELPAEIRDETRTMVLRLDGQRIAIVVDEVREVMRVDSTTIAAPPPIVRGLAAAYVSGILTRGERTIVLLHALRLLTTAERVQLADAVAGAPESPPKAAAARTAGARR